MKLRIGFLGVGAMGLSHLEAMHVGQASRAEAVAICARDPAHLARARAVAPGARVYGDELALIRSDLDAVCVSTPNFTHARLALATLRAGRHLFLEKPVGITRDECRQVLEAAAATDRVVMLGHELRYSRFFQKFKALVAAGQIGRPRLVWTREFRGPFQKKSGDWLEDPRRSGGALVDKSCHHFDLMNWWVGSRPRRVCAFGGCAAAEAAGGAKSTVQRPSAEVRSPGVGPRIPPSAFGMRQAERCRVLDHATASFEYENGVRGALQLCLFARDFPAEELEMGIVGDGGELRTRIARPRAVRSPSFGRGSQEAGRRTDNGVLEILQWRRESAQTEPTVHVIESRRGEGWGGHLGFAEIHEAFVRAVCGRERPLTTVAECVDGTLLAIAAEESIRRGRVVRMG